MVRRRSSPVTPGLDDRRVVEHRPAARVALRRRGSAARQRGCPGRLLDAVLAAALAVDEARGAGRRAWSPGRRRPAGRPARARTRGRCRRRRLAAWRARIRSASLGLEAAGEDDVGLAAVGSWSRRVAAAAASRPEERDERRSGRRRWSGVSWSGAATRRSRATVVASRTVPVRS